MYQCQKIIESGKQYPKEFCTNKYEKHIACSYGYKLVCVDGKFIKPFKTYCKNAVHNFINNIIEGIKYSTEVTKKHFNKELVMTKEDNEDIKNFTKSWICDNDYLNNDAKLGDRYNITGKFRSSAHRYQS